jgi:predicted  nucleic acid-binding Zn-ribbon protein
MGGKNVQEKIRLLIELQNLDLELSKIRQSRRELEAEQAELGAGLDRVQIMLDSLAAEIEKLQSERRELGQASVQEQENVKKAEGRLPTIKTQKEYVAVLKEIDTAKKLNKDNQDRIQEKDSEIEALGRDKEEKEEEISALKAKVEAQSAEIAAALGKFDQSLTEKGGKRETLLNQLPAPLRKRYEMLLERRNGLAVVEARNGTCLGCHMQLPPQFFNSLLTFREIKTCPHCNRILYVVMEQ